VRLDSRVPTCESPVAKSLRALGFVGTRHFRSRFLFELVSAKERRETRRQETHPPPRQGLLLGATRTSGSRVLGAGRKPALLGFPCKVGLVLSS
jgi:hypothetical protein